MRKILLLVFFFSTLTFALKPHQASYTLLVSNVKIAKENRSLHQKGNIYYYTSHAKTTGLIKLIKDYEVRSKSTFSVDMDGLKSKIYQNFEKEGNQVKKDFTVYPKDQQVDSLNRVLAIAHELQKNPKKAKFQLWVHNGKLVEQQNYQQVPSDKDNLIKIVNKEKNLVVYFDKDRYYLPILLHRDNFIYKLDAIRF